MSAGHALIFNFMSLAKYILKNAWSLWPLLLAGTPISSVSAEQVMVHEGREAFLEGTLGNAGQNLFVDAKGEIRPIEWFDFNADGYPEVLTVNDHNPYENVDVMIYYNHPTEGLRSLYPDAHEDMPDYQKLEWMQQRLGEIQFLPSLGGGVGTAADLNGNGYLDLVFPNFMHGWAQADFPLYLYWGSAAGYSATQRSTIPSLRSARAVVSADITGNGKLDLVVANYGMEYHANKDFFGEQYTSYVYVQGERGFVETDRIEFPTEFAIDVKAVDLTGEGNLSLVFLNAGSNPRLRIFTADENGVDPARYYDVPVADAGISRYVSNRITVGDLNGSGLPDLFVSSKGDVSEIFWNEGGKYDESNRTELTTKTAHGALIKDLNGDGYAELVIPQMCDQSEDDPVGEFEIESLIYYGTPTGPDWDNATRLPTLGAVAVDAADLNNDGFEDLVFANFRNTDTYDVPSYIYWGSAEGYSRFRRSDLTGFGPVDVLLKDFSGNGMPDVCLINRFSGSTYGNGIVPSYVYWGNEDGVHSPAASTTLPLKGGYVASAADLSGNGQADLIFTTDRSLTVAYGKEGDYAEEDFQIFALPYRGFSTAVSDLNGDGYLDVLVGGISRDKESSNIALLYGGEDGLSDPEFVQIDYGVISAALGDVTGDGNLDLILGGRYDLLILPFGDDGRPDTNNIQRIVTPRQTQKISLADMNGDGMLDILAAHFRDYETKRLNSPSAIYWNQDGNFDFERRTELPSYGAHWISAGDVYNRGQLDVIISNYHGEFTRILDLYIYEDDGEGGYRRRESLPAMSSSSHLLADLNGNGHKDLVVFNHTGHSQYTGLSSKSGVHGYGSYIYYGDGGDFSKERRVKVPSFGPHKTIDAEWGDVLKRDPYEVYVSAWEEQELAPGAYRFIVKGDFHPNTALGLDVRTDSDEPWKALSAASDNADGVRSFSWSLNQSEAALQYRLRLGQGTSGTPPSVRSVELLRD